MLLENGQFRQQLRDRNDNHGISVCKTKAKKTQSNAEILDSWDSIKEMTGR